jgi:hypothetical protein
MNEFRPSLDLVLIVTGGVLAAVLLGVGLVFLRRYRARRALHAAFESIAHALLADVLLPDGSGGWFHVDFLLLTEQGLLVIDLRDVAGLIFGSEQMTEWTVMHKGRRHTFGNPLGPLFDRVAVVRQLAGDAVPVDGRVVFTERGSFPKGHPPLVTRLASLAREFPPLAPLAGGAGELYLPAFERVRAAGSPSPLKRR